MTQRGFTLIETIIYIALLSFIIGGAVATAYNLIQGSTRLNANTAVQEEGGFVMRKLDWALASASGLDASVPQQLTITRYDGITIMVKLLGTAVVMQETGGAFIPLTTNNVSVTDLVFTDIPAKESRPEGVTATLTVSSTTFSTTRYLRK